jgi:hypothetical protein
MCWQLCGGINYKGLSAFVCATVGSAQLHVSVGYWVSLQLDQHNYVFR